MAIGIAAERTLPSWAQTAIQPREKLIEGFRSVQAAELTGVSVEEIVGLTSRLNDALALQRKANLTGSLGDMESSIILLSQVSSDATALQSRAQAIGQLKWTAALALSLVLGVFTSYVIVEHLRLLQLLRRKTSGITRRGGGHLA